MSFQSPVGICRTNIPGLGTLDGLEFASGVQQFCGIPYAHLPKRWTRSTLNIEWEGGHHDGTKMGYGCSEFMDKREHTTHHFNRNDCPSPIVDGDDSDDLVPVPPAVHFSDPRIVDELSALVMNIVIPHAFDPKAEFLPVFVYVHGGSLLYGGANLPIFDAVNLVSHSIAIGLHIICVNFNYRVGIGGFLAGTAIADELKRDGYAGSGNFGFTDQHIAFEWIQRYIQYLGGDAQNITAVGESAGGISISNQLLAAKPPTFHRAVCMSGLSAAIPAWDIQQHDHLFEAVCKHFGIDPGTSEALEQLRAIHQQELANATPIIQGVPSGTGNPCLDGWFYHSGVDPRLVHPLPSWLKGYMIGDTYHEGIIFHLNLLGEDFDSVRNILHAHICDDSHTDYILKAYGIAAGLPHDEFLSRVEHMCGDAIFKIPNYLLSQKCEAQLMLEHSALYLYHFDQRSRLRNALEGTAYHAHELLYLFGNLSNELNEQERNMAREFAAAWIRFSNGLAPWSARDKSRKWMVWGPDSQMAMKDENEDQVSRDYARMKSILRLEEERIFEKWMAGVDALVNRRHRPV